MVEQELIISKQIGLDNKFNLPQKSKSVDIQLR